ncbi:MAG: hypothetical protein LBR79_00955 [Oscillospiraceae bacterium]|nr:hypothetical protein [Oscillospiraceae bacterium]
MKFLLSPPRSSGEKDIINYSCYALKKSSKVNLSVYFLPAVGWEKVIKKV